MDKTGTLTKGEPEVTDLIAEAISEPELLGLVAASFPLLTLALCDSIEGCSGSTPRAMFGGSYVGSVERALASYV